MAVLKSHNAPPAMKEAIVLDLGDIGAQAAKIHMAAQSRANDIVAGAQARAEELAKTRLIEAADTGHTEGFDRGMAEGIEQGKAEAFTQAAQQIAQLESAWSQVVTQWESQRTAMQREARQSVLEFALRTAEKLVHRVVEVDPEVVVDQVGAALDLVLNAHDVSVCIHPVDRPTVEKALPSLLAEIQTLNHVGLVDDEDISPGGCVVSFGGSSGGGAGGGRIDARIEQQMERIIDMILPLPALPEMPEMPEAVADEVAEPVVEESAGNDLSPEIDASADAAIPDDTGFNSDAQHDADAEDDSTQA